MTPFELINCYISQFVNIGSNHGKAASIGNNVYIGAGAVVVKDIPKNATAVGNQAKVINYNSPAKYINNRFENEVELGDISR